MLYNKEKGVNMFTRFCLIMLALVGVGMYIQNNTDFGKIKQDAINALKTEKTINTVNSSRAQNQANIDSVTNR